MLMHFSNYSISSIYNSCLYHRMCQQIICQMNE